MSEAKSTMDRESAFPRLEFIDALRGFGAVYILLFHMPMIPQPQLGVPVWLRNMLYPGHYAVTLFFLLSGFSLMLSMRARAQEPHPVRSFYIRRFFRIAPLFYAWLAVSLIRDQVWFHTPHPPGTILLNLLFGFDLIPGKELGIVWASWLIGAEMVFYVIFPLLYRYINDLWKAVGLFFATVFLSGGVAYVLTNVFVLEPEIRDSYIRYGFFHQLPVLVLGMVLYFIYEQHIWKKRRPWSWGIACIGAAIFLFGAHMDNRLEFLMDMWYWQAVTYAFLVIGLSMAPVRLFVNPALRYFGRISYSVYINHPTIIRAFVPIYLVVYGWQLPVTLHYGISALLTLGVLTPLSILTYWIIERPGIRLGGWIIRRWQGVRNPKPG